MFAVFIRLATFLATIVTNNILPFIGNISMAIAIFGHFLTNFILFYILCSVDQANHKFVSKIGLGLTYILIKVGIYHFGNYWKH